MRRSPDRLLRRNVGSSPEWKQLRSVEFEVWASIWLASIWPRLSSFREDAGDAADDADERTQAADRQCFYLTVPAVKLLQKVLDGNDAGGHSGLRRTFGLGFDRAAPEHGEGGNDLALDTLLDDREEKGPDVGGGLEEVATIADATIDMQEVPALQFLQTCA